jgi:hypothetical protein
VRRQGVMAAHESDKIERAKRVVSDEAIDDVQWMTRKIVQLRAKGKA